MKYFTSELHEQFNSDDLIIANRAEVAWEKAINDYQTYLSSLQMPATIRKLADLYLHDGVIKRINYQGNMFSFDVHMQGVTPEVHYKIIYITWGKVKELRPENWPFPYDKPAAEYFIDEIPPLVVGMEWLYSEIEQVDEIQYWHRVSCSDGREFEIPFVSVYIEELRI